MGGWCKVGSRVCEMLDKGFPSKEVGNHGEVVRGKGNFIASLEGQVQPLKSGIQEVRQHVVEQEIGKGTCR